MARIDIAGGRNHQPFRPILLLQPVQAVAPVKPTDGRFIAEHRPRQSLLAERGFEQMVVDQIVGSIEAFAKLRQDDQFLALQLGLVELRRPDQVGDELKRQADIGSQACGHERRSGPATSRR